MDTYTNMKYRVDTSTTKAWRRASSGIGQEKMTEVVTKVILDLVRMRDSKVKVEKRVELDISLEIMVVIRSRKVLLMVVIKVEVVVVIVVGEVLGEVVGEVNVGRDW